MPPEIDAPSIMDTSFPGLGIGEEPPERIPRRKAAPSDADRESIDIPSGEDGDSPPELDDIEPAPKPRKKPGAKAAPAADQDEEDEDGEPDDDQDAADADDDKGEEEEDSIESLRAENARLKAENAKRRRKARRPDTGTQQLARKVEELETQLREVRKTGDPEPDIDADPEGHAKWRERRTAEERAQERAIQEASAKLHAQVEVVRDRHDGSDGLPTFDEMYSRWRSVIAEDKALQARVLAAPNQARELFKAALELQDEANIEDDEEAESLVDLYEETYGRPKGPDKKERRENSMSARKAAAAAPRKGARNATVDSPTSTTSDSEFRRIQKMFPGIYKTKADYEKAAKLHDKIAQKRKFEEGV